jgi:hypothetical protein
LTWPRAGREAGPMSSTTLFILGAYLFMYALALLVARRGRP